MTDKTPGDSAVSLAGTGSSAGAVPLDPKAAWLQRWEIVAVLAVSLGASGVYALVSYIGSLTARQSLSKQTAVLNGTLAPGRPLLDLFLQLTNITLALAPVLWSSTCWPGRGRGRPRSAWTPASQAGTWPGAPGSPRSSAAAAWACT